MSASTKPTNKKPKGQSEAKEKETVEAWQTMGQEESTDEELYDTVRVQPSKEKKKQASRSSTTPATGKKRRLPADLSLSTPETARKRPLAADQFGMPTPETARKLERALAKLKDPRPASVGNPDNPAPRNNLPPPPPPPPPPGGGPVDPANDPDAPAWVKPTVHLRKRTTDYTVRMSHSWTVGDGTFDPIPQDKRRQQDVPFPAFINIAYRARSALTSLQFSHDAPIPLSALDVACAHIWKCMPSEAGRYLHVEKPNGPGLWGSSEEAKAAMYTRMSDQRLHLPLDNGTDETEYRQYVDLKMRPWVIWPLWVEDQWGSDYVTVIWYSDNTAKQIDRYDQLRAYAIIDPRRSPDADGEWNQRHPPIEARLQRIRNRLFELWEYAGFNLQNAKPMNILSSPMPFTEATSGERCFAAVKALINQVIDWYTSGQQFNHDTTITSMTQWVNPFQQRVEMTGICAWVLMASLDYSARVTVEAILPNSRWEIVSNGQKKYVQPYDLAGPYEEPPIASYDYLLPPNNIYKAPAAQ